MESDRPGTRPWWARQKLRAEQRAQALVFVADEIDRWTAYQAGLAELAGKAGNDNIRALLQMEVSLTSLEAGEARNRAVLAKQMAAYCARIINEIDAADAAEDRRKPDAD